LLKTSILLTITGNMSADFKNILIIKPSSLGDIILTLPALSALRRNFPQARISWLVRPELAALLENHPHLDDLIFFDRRFLGKAWFNPDAFAGLLALIRRLRRAGFDLIFDFQGLFRSASLSWLTGCKSRFGMAGARELAHIFYTQQIKQDSSCVHLVDYYLKMVNQAGAEDTAVEFMLPEDAEAVDSVGRLLTGFDIGADDYAVFVPGSAHPDKRWPVENFAELAGKISDEFGLSIIATASEAEKELTAGLKSKTNVPVIDLAGRTTLKQLIALLRQSKIVISNDTGPGHIAAALGVPVVLIFGRSNPARVCPYQKQSCIAAIEPFDRGLEINSTDPRHDIRNVTVDMVYKAVCGQLNHPGIKKS